MSQQKPAFSTAATARHILVCLLLFLAGDLLSSLAFDLLFAVARPPAPWLYQLPRALGALALYISDGTVAAFQPMNINFGIIEPLGHRVKGKRNKNLEISNRSLAVIGQLRDEVVKEAVY